jgi:hypothetical protein
MFSLQLLATTSLWSQMRPIALTISLQTMVIVVTTNYSHKFVKLK